MHTHILETRSQAFFISVVITVVTLNTSTTFSQSVSFLFFLASNHRAPFSVITAIRQSKPYTVTFFTVQYGVLQFFFTVSIILFHLSSSSYSLAFGKRNGDDSHMVHVP